MGSTMVQAEGKGDWDPSAPCSKSRVDRGRGRFVVGGEFRCGAVRVYLYYFDSFRTLMVHVMVHLERVLFSQLSSQDIDARSGAVEQLRRY